MALTSMSFTSAALQVQQRPILGQDVPIAISRIGSVSDAATRELLKSVGLKPIDDVALRQIGGAPERISAFSQGAVAGFINPPGSIHLIGKAVPHKVLISMADLEKPPAFPWACAATTKSFWRKGATR